MNLNDVKQIEICIAKFRILLNDIELISYDIEQLKQSNHEDKDSVTSINNQWEDLLKQVNDKYNLFENRLQEIRTKQKLIEQYHAELNSIDKKVVESTLSTKFDTIIESLESVEEHVNKEFTNDDDDNEPVKELKSKRIINFDKSKLYRFSVKFV